MFENYNIIVSQGPHGHGKVTETHGILSFHSGPGKVMEFWKNCLGHGKVTEFIFLPNSFLGCGC